MNSTSAASSYNLFTQAAASLSMLQTMQNYAAAAAGIRPPPVPSAYYISPTPQSPHHHPHQHSHHHPHHPPPHPPPTLQQALKLKLAPAAPVHSPGRLVTAVPPPQPPPPPPPPPPKTADATADLPRLPSVAAPPPQKFADNPATGAFVETVLEGKTIFAFNVGGEKRLCLPQVLNNVLLCAGATLADINRVCEDLNIFCRRCNGQQMSILKERKVFGPNLENCGLITKSDAERLCKGLLNVNLPPFKAPLTPKDGVSVYHSCFGKQRGFLIPRLYTSPDAPCIVCSGCGALLAPSQFVGHVHSKPERDTCHWGFDSTKWRLYLLLDRRLGNPAAASAAAASPAEDLDGLEKVLEAVKAKFDRKRASQAALTGNGSCTDAFQKRMRAAPESIHCQQQQQQQQQQRQANGGTATALPICTPVSPPPMPSACLKAPLPHPLGLANGHSAPALLGDMAQAQKCGLLVPAGPVPTLVADIPSHRDFAPNVRLPTVAVLRAAAAAVAAAASASATPKTEDCLMGGRTEKTPMAVSIEETIASEWESLTDWGEGHLPEKATPQFLAMVEKVKAGYQSHIAELKATVDRQRLQLSSAEQAAQELELLRRQLDEQRSPDVRKLRMKYTAQKEELAHLEAERQRLQAALDEALALRHRRQLSPSISNGSPPSKMFATSGVAANSSSAAVSGGGRLEDGPPSLEMQCV